MAVETTKLPPMLEGVVERTFQQATTDPENFVYESVARLEDICPALIKNRLIQALRISRSENPVASMAYLTGTLFIPSCFEALARATESKRPILPYKTIKAVNETQLPDGLLAQRIKDYSPALASAARKLNGADLPNLLSAQTSEDLHANILMTFAYFEQQATSPAPLDLKVDLGTMQDSPPPALPLVRRSIVNKALLDICFKPDRFLDKVARKVAINCPNLEINFRGGEEGKKAVQLVSCLINQGMIEEHKKRAEKVPWPDQASIDVMVGDFEDMLPVETNTGTPNFPVHAEVIKEYIKKVAPENPYLWDGVMVLGQATGVPLGIIIQAGYLNYKPWRNFSEANYCKRVYYRETQEPIRFYLN